MTNVSDSTYTPFLSMTDESRHQLVSGWWDQLAKYTIVLAAAGWPPERIAAFMAVTLADVERVLLPEPPELVWSEIAPAAIQQHHLMVTEVVAGILAHACGLASHAAQAEGFDAAVVAAVQTQREMHRRQSTIARRKALELTVSWPRPGLDVAFQCLAMECGRRALGIQKSPGRSLALLALIEWHDRVADHGACERIPSEPKPARRRRR